MSLPMPLEPENPKELGELRVSHEDRDQVAEALRVAAGDGRLTMEELDERLEAALTARTYADLAPLLADLPGAGAGVPAPSRSAAPAPVQPRELVRVKRVGGNLAYDGAWPVPKRLEMELHGGSARLDYTHAVVGGAESEIRLRMRGGSLRITVPSGYAVDTMGLSIRGGGVRDRSQRGAEPGALVLHRITVVGELVGGSVVVDPPGQPAQRRPGLLRRIFGRKDR
ncbi:DUF1707 domain-containing protein [Streptacidiphilus sp. PB12-B1b]|uniref:DUF1707 SHOCT-like domain-containing protein n=1 Tax=Streptacidiphilus sp. PB12-B1b TaxID=2705012 RepID=UPI0015F928D7|nr:DUF1707 domain-containing protein [Streptacidiphilus sp. PB12-B1b]QMU77741.1 DUF1707 domain-containing protein [Streptacidiphilus sp. PB12-B1b]